MEPSDSFLEALKYTEPDFYPNIRQLLIIGCVSPISFTEAERATSGFHRLKMPYRSIMSGGKRSEFDLTSKGNRCRQK